MSYKLTPKLETFRFINTMILYSWILKVGKHNMRKLRGRKDVKNKKNKENGKGETDERGYGRNKVNLVIRKSSDFEVNVYHFVIY